MLYILDEPSIGLHQRDNDMLLATMKRLRDLGNTLLVVEHDEDTMRAADYIVDIGPGPGFTADRWVAAGTVEEVMNTPGSITGDYLSGPKKIPVPAQRERAADSSLTVRGGREQPAKCRMSPSPGYLYLCHRCVRLGQILPGQ